jgi:hypothetical protein
MHRRETMNDPSINWNGDKPKPEQSKPVRIATNVLITTICVAFTALIIIGIVKLTLIAFF